MSENPERPMSPAVLRELWDFDDAAASERRFASAAADRGLPESHRGELATQRARALGLLGRFDEAFAVLGAIGDPSGVVGVRVLLERGRVRNSAGDASAAIPLFGAAVEAARASGAEQLVVDALHMLAIADVGHDGTGPSARSTSSRIRRTPRRCAGRWPCTTTSAGPCTTAASSSPRSKSSSWPIGRRSSSATLSRTASRAGRSLGACDRWDGSRLPSRSSGSSWTGRTTLMRARS